MNLGEVQRRPNQQTFEDVVSASSYLGLLSVELCQEVPLLVVELGNLLVPQLQIITQQSLCFVNTLLESY